jgi:hypothetical protein
MDNMFSVAAAAALVFLLLRFLDMRMIAKEKRPMKDLLKEGLLVYLSTCGGMFLLRQVDNMGAVAGGNAGKTNVYTGEPSF